MQTVRFWFFIYTQFNSNQVVIHDKNNLSLIYGILDFSSINEKNLSRNTSFILQQKITRDKVALITSSLKKLTSNPFSLDPWAKDVYGMLLRSGVNPPIGKESRIQFFKSLSENIRTQTGQKNFIRAGINRSLPFRNFLYHYFESKKLPTELLAIPFLESSFNPEAQSKVNALGAWQFMPLIASYFLPRRRDNIDYRFNVALSSISAAFLMQENYKILKSWDLAVTAYNSGTKHLLKTKRQLGFKHINLQHIINHSDSKHFGFASKNFYSEFLALVHTLAYRDELFDDLDVDDDLMENDFHFYLTKCSLNFSKTISTDLIEDIDLYNHHFFDFKKTFHAGLIVSTKKELPSRYFYKLSFEKVLAYKPVEWPKFLKNQNCSTR